MYLLFIAIVILLLLLFLYYYRNKSSNNDYIHIESFNNFENNDDNYQDFDNYGNLIKNGSFNNSSNLKNYINQNGYNKIINIVNPGKSNFALNQKKSDNTFYEFSIDININSNYILYFWISLNNEIDVQEFDFEKYLKIRIPKKDFNNYLPKFKYNIIKKTEFNDKLVWYHLKIIFDTTNNIQDKAFISLNINNDNSNNNFNNIYITDLSSYKVLPDAQNFIFNKDLIYYGDANSYQSHNNIFKDLTGNSNDIYFSSIPNSDMSSGYINLLNTKIEGFNSNIINNNEFTIFMIINKQNDLPKINALVDDSNNNINDKNNIYEKILLCFPGNNKYSFEILIENDYLVLKNDKINIKSKEKLNYYNKSSLVIIYKDGKINIFNEGINIISSKIDKIYFNDNKFIINKNKNIDLFLYSFLIYNRVVDNNELKKIREYFITNQNKNYNKIPNILEHSFDNVFSQNHLNDPLVKPYENIDLNNKVKLDTFKNYYDNQDYTIKNNCSDKCFNLCNKYLNNSNPDIDSYKKCISNCKNVLPECTDYCQEEDNNDSIYCKNKNDNNSIVCPKVYKKNNNYYVYIPPNSYYSHLYEGEKSYGNDIEKARYMYSINFPKCLLPEEFQVSNSKKTTKANCPYVMNELNPCNISDCLNVNWNVSNYKDLNLNKNCKKAISNYCHINYKYDPHCICWDPKYRNDSKCIEFKKFFENPKDYCKPSSFNIEDHPDFNKYVRKDNIPCWGCKL